MVGFEDFLQDDPICDKMIFLKRPKAHMQVGSLWTMLLQDMPLHGPSVLPKRVQGLFWSPGRDSAPGTHSPVGIYWASVAQQCREDPERPRPALRPQVSSEPSCRWGHPAAQLPAVTASGSFELRSQKMEVWGSGRTCDEWVPRRGLL